MDLNIRLTTGRNAVVPKRGKNMPSGKGWRLVSPAGKMFVATLRTTLNEGPTKRYAIFSVPK